MSFWKRQNGDISVEVNIENHLKMAFLSCFLVLV